jgi:hypothetical protein
MMATMSASMCFFPSFSKQAKWAKPGALILHLYGFGPPSDTRYTPNSPAHQTKRVNCCEGKTGGLVIVTFGCLDGSVGSTGRNCEPLREQLKVMNQSLHGILHLTSRWRGDLGVVCPDGTFRHLVQALVDYPQRLTHLLNSTQVPEQTDKSKYQSTLTQTPSPRHRSPIVAISLRSDRHVKFHKVVSVVWLRLPQVPLDA